ncbi:LysR family transcriptional regulator [Micromonospora echinospora]|uniref:LysR family transcriptional regulator n=1 Tax=Micromonospora echinospora TaxID=1877 RepID=UPI003A852D1A
MSIELRHLRYFVAVADNGQVQRAARVLHLTQPAVTQAVRDLERQLGVELFVRWARGTALTAAGEEFYVRATQALAAVDEAVDAVRRSGRPQPDGTLRIGFLPLTISPVAREVLQVFRAARPDVRVRMRQLTFVNQWRSLLDGELDLAILHLPVDEERLSAIPLQRERRYVALSARHPLAESATIHPDDLADEPRPGLDPEVPAAFADQLTLAGSYGAVPFTDDEISTPEEAVAVIVNSRAVLTGPECHARLHRQPGLTWRPLDDVGSVVTAIVMAGNGTGPLVRAFADVARQVVTRRPVVLA